MSSTSIQPGKRLTYQNSGAAIAVDSVVFVGSLPGIAVTAIAATTGEGELDVCGVHRLTKVAPLVIAQGDRVYWDTSAKKVTKTITDNLLGIAWAGAVSAAVTVDVKLLDIAAAVPAAGFDQAAFVAALVNSGGGAAANGTIEAISAASAATTDTSAASLASVNTTIGLIANAITELASKQEAIRVALVNAGIMAAS